MIFFRESDPGWQTPAVRGVRPVFGRGIWERECSGIRARIYACLCAWMGEAVIILVCTAGSTGAVLWHATRLHSICSNQNKNTRGTRGLARHSQVTNPPRHNTFISLSLTITTQGLWGDSLQWASRTYVAKCNNGMCLNPHFCSSFFINVHGKVTALTR